jgi:hypothetical protein
MGGEGMGEVRLGRTVGSLFIRSGIFISKGLGENPSLGNITSSPEYNALWVEVVSIRKINFSSVECTPKN